MAELPRGTPKMGPFWGPGALEGPRRAPEGPREGPGPGPGPGRGPGRGPGPGPRPGPGSREGSRGPSGASGGPERARWGLGGARGGVRTGSRDRPRARRVPPDGLLELKTVGFCWFSVRIIVFGLFGHLKCAFSKATVCKIQSREMLFLLGLSSVCSVSSVEGTKERSGKCVSANVPVDSYRV